MPKINKPKKLQNQKNKRTFYITDSNLGILQELENHILSEPNWTKLINYVIDSVLGTWLKTYEIEAKTPAQKDKLNLNLTKEIKKYASTEKSFR